MVLKLKRCWFVVWLAVCVKGSCNEHTQCRVGWGGRRVRWQAIESKRNTSCFFEERREKGNNGGRGKTEQEAENANEVKEPQKWLSLSQLSSARVVGGKSPHYGAAHRANCADCGGSRVSGGRKLVAGAVTSRSPEALQWREIIVFTSVLGVGRRWTEYTAGPQLVMSSN